MPNHYYSFTWHIYRKAMQSIHILLNNNTYPRYFNKLFYLFHTKIAPFRGAISMYYF